MAYMLMDKAEKCCPLRVSDPREPRSGSVRERFVRGGIRDTRVSRHDSSGAGRESRETTQRETRLYIDITVIRQSQRLKRDLPRERALRWRVSTQTKNHFSTV